MVGIKIASAHDASGIDNISVYIGQTIPEAGTVKGLIHWGTSQDSLGQIRQDDRIINTKTPVIFKFSAMI